MSVNSHNSESMRVHKNFKVLVDKTKKNLADVFGVEGSDVEVTKLIASMNQGRVMVIVRKNGKRKKQLPIEDVFPYSQV